MSNFVAKKVTQKILKEVSGTQPGGNNKTGKAPNRAPAHIDKRGPPAGLTKKEEKTLKKVQRNARWLDTAFNFCGLKVGWGAIFGLVPFVGDFADTIFALLVYRTCCQVDLPASMKSKMMFNIMVDFAIGLVPMLGDFADALWKANTKNAELLYDHLETVGAQRIETGGIVEDNKGSRNRSQSRGRGGIVHQQPAVDMKGQTPGAHGQHVNNVQRPEQVRTKSGGQLDRKAAQPPRGRDYDVENGEHVYYQSQGHAHQETGRTGRR